MPDPCCNADRGGLPMNLTIARGRIISERPAFSPRLISPMNPAAIVGWTSFFETSDPASSLRVGVSGGGPEEDTSGGFIETALPRRKVEARGLEPLSTKRSARLSTCLDDL